MRRETLGLLTVLCAVAPGCAIRPGPVTMDTVGEFDLCLCTTAEPLRSDREQCAAELARRNLACDQDYWSAYWARRQGR